MTRVEEVWSPLLLPLGTVSRFERWETCSFSSSPLPPILRLLCTHPLRVHTDVSLDVKLPYDSPRPSSLLIPMASSIHHSNPTSL